jgi:hypothetical protein
MLNNFANKITNNQTKNEELLFSIGSKIINNFLINSSITNKDYYITDIEFYISSPIHTIDKDITTNREITHCHPRQLEKEIYYIHRIGHKSDSFSLIQGAGIDLCFGDVSSNTFIGILIREIKDVQTDEIFHVPQKVLKTLLNLPVLYGEYKEKFITLAKEIESETIFSKSNPLFIKKSLNNLQTEQTKRVNVNNNLLYRVKAI